MDYLEEWQAAKQYLGHWREGGQGCDMLPRLEALLQASPKVASFQVVDSDAIDEDNFLLKIRCELTSGCAFQIRLRAVAGDIRYAYPEFTHRPLRR